MALGNSGCLVSNFWLLTFDNKGVLRFNRQIRERKLFLQIGGIQ
jgi:hypothetical protein